jgi:hypothetical protein
MIPKKQQKEVSIIKSVLAEEVERSKQMESLYKKELETLPKGSIQMKKIRGKEYPYLCYRMGKKVKTEYVKKEQFDEVWKKLEKRKQLESSLKRLKEDRQLALRVIGK